jgi:hypothetical protein
MKASSRFVAAGRADGSRASLSIAAPAIRHSVSHQSTASGTGANGGGAGVLGVPAALGESDNEEDEDETANDEADEHKENALVAYFDSVNAEGGAKAKVPAASESVLKVERAVSSRVVGGLQTEQPQSVVGSSPRNRAFSSAFSQSSKHVSADISRSPSLVAHASLASSSPKRKSIVKPGSVAVAVNGVPRNRLSSVSPLPDLALPMTTIVDVAPDTVVPQHSACNASADEAHAIPDARHSSAIADDLATSGVDDEALTQIEPAHHTASSSHWAVLAFATIKTRKVDKVVDTRLVALFYDYLGICLSRPLARSSAAAWEEEFQFDSQPGWIGFIRTSIVLALGVMLLFLVSDRVNNYLYSDVEPTLLIIRYGVASPILIGFLGLTYLRIFRESWWFTQVSTSLVILAVGVCIIATSVVGGQPGYGLLALYLVYCLNFSIVALLLRVVVLTILVVGFTVASSIQSAALGRSSSTGIFFAYLLLFTISECIPVFQREHTIRQNFLRKSLIKKEQRDLAIEQARSNKLLENLLPPVIVIRLRAANRQLIADTFENVTVSFCW